MPRPDQYARFDKWVLHRSDRVPHRVKVVLELSNGDFAVTSWDGTSFTVAGRDLHDTFEAAKESCIEWVEHFGMGNGSRKVSEGLREIKEGKEELAKVKAIKKPTKPITSRRDCC